jgi:hypothetical protein
MYPSKLCSLSVSHDSKTCACILWILALDSALHPISTSGSSLGTLPEWNTDIVSMSQLALFHNDPYMTSGCQHHQHKNMWA